MGGGLGGEKLFNLMLSELIVDIGLIGHRKDTPDPSDNSAYKRKKSETRNHCKAKFWLMQDCNVKIYNISPLFQSHTHVMSQRCYTSSIYT